jgi:MHS family alpha-ketoglutarate permease-like MFS transporter
MQRSIMSVSSQSAGKSVARYVGLGGGIALEWYDWTIYGLMAALMAPHFFPSHDPVTSTLSALAVFALGFVVRPVSGAIFGPIADRIGHKKILMWSIGAMAVCSLVIGLMPGYDVIGPAAGILVLVARMVQGVSTGIEQPAANAAAMELARPGKQGFFSGVVNGSFNQGGNLLASLIAFLTSLTLGGEVMGEWGWRIPFVVGGLAGLVVMFIRKALPETGAALDTAEKHRSTGEIWRDIWAHRLAVIAIVFVVGGTMIANYTWITGLPNLANASFNEDPTPVFAITTGLMVMMVLAGPVAGLLSDRFGSSRVYLILRIALVPAYFLVLLYAQPGLGTLALVMLGGGVVLALNQVLFNYITATLVPQRIRTTGIALGYGIAVMLFGGTASYLLVAANQNGLLWLFVTYGAVVAALSVLMYAWAMRKGYVANSENESVDVAASDPVEEVDLRSR